MQRKMLMLLFVVAVMACLGALPATAGETPGTNAPVLGSTPAPVGCGLDLAFAPAAAAMCPAVATPLAPAPAANPFAHRTCRCSCGYPCKTDADCGPGGVCAPGVTCC